MAISRPCYCSRDDVMRSIDIKDGAISTAQVDRAIASGADKIEGRMMRKFYPLDTTRFLDWPNYQYAAPWRMWLGKQDCCALTLLQSPGNSGGAGGVSIPLNQVFLEPVNRDPGFPFRSIELDRSTVAAWGIGPTPQHSIWATGTFGFTADADTAASLAASIAASDTTMTLSDGSQCGPGDLLIIGYGRGTAPYPTYLGTAGAVQPYLGERIIVTDKTAAATGLTQSGSGCTTASGSDNQLTTTGTGALNPGEVLQLDGERMLVESVTAGTATVVRAWDGTVLAVHSGAPVYAMRLLTVLRGELGTTAASASSGTTVARHRPPQLIRDLNIAIGADQVMQELSGYSRTVGAGDAQMRASGYALADLWDQAARRFGRQQRIGAI
jgi:hypothetical protein